MISAAWRPYRRKAARSAAGEVQLSLHPRSPRAVADRSASASTPRATRAKACDARPRFGNRPCSSRPTAQSSVGRHVPPASLMLTAGRWTVRSTAKSCARPTVRWRLREHADPFAAQLPSARPAAGQEHDEVDRPGVGGRPGGEPAVMEPVSDAAQLRVSFSTACLSSILRLLKSCVKSPPSTEL